MCKFMVSTFVLITLQMCFIIFKKTTTLLSTLVSVSQVMVKSQVTLPLFVVDSTRHLSGIVNQNSWYIKSHNINQDRITIQPGEPYIALAKANITKWLRKDLTGETMAAL